MAFFERAFENIKKNENLDLRLRELRGLKDELSKITGKCYCPTCGREFDEEYSNKIRILLDIVIIEINETIKEMERLKSLMAPKMEKKRLKREEERKKRKEQVKKYIDENKKKFRMAIQLYRKGEENYLPDIQEEEKELWNDAIESFIENSPTYSNELDYTDFQF